MYGYTTYRRGGTGKTFLTILLTFFITIGVMKYTTHISNDIENNGKISDLEQKSQRLNYNQESLNMQEESKLLIEKDFVTIVRENMPSVVGISVLKPEGDGVLDFNVTKKWGIGTGLIVSNKGYILTNQHLASDVNGVITVTLENGKEIKGKTIWNEANLDLAIIKIDTNDNLKVAKLGSAKSSEIGEDVIAIGNPLGLEFQKTVTKGVVSGLSRTLKVEDERTTVIMENLIQTDASINTGNSGGPLINSYGEVIGINTVKITSAEGIGFAVPIDIVKPILEKLERNEKFEEGYLGIFAYDAEIVPYLNREIDTNSGIYVATVNVAGPSYIAGIKEGDIILKVDNVEINKMNELREFIYKKGPGDKIELIVLRDNSEIIKEITLGKK